MIIREGSVEFYTGTESFGNGPGTRSAGFYNTSQELNRNITECFLSSVKPVHILDGFGGTGVRGIRIVKELGINVTIAEPNPKSMEMIKENCRLNEVNPELFEGRFEAAVTQDLYDYMDIDPYGTSIPFIFPAISYIRNHGYIGVTATDLTGLTGSSPEKTMRRYQASIQCDEFKHEMGIRLLISTIIRYGASIDIAAYPLMSLWHSHYYRVFFRIEHGAGKADSLMDKIGIIDKHTDLTGSAPNIVEGPVWKGNLQNHEILNGIRIPGSIENNSSVNRYLGLFRNDDLQFLFMDMALESKFRKRNIPPLSLVMERLSENGIASGRTQFSYRGIKTSDPGGSISLIDSLYGNE